MTEQNRDEAVNPEPEAVIGDLQPQPQVVTDEDVDGIRGGSSNLANMQHEVLKAVVQNLRG